MSGRQFFSACLVVASAAWAWGQADPASTYQTLLGEEESKVLRTRSRTDDAAFAAKLLEMAHSVPDSPAFQALLCEKAYEFGLKHKAGYASAAAAMELLMATSKTQVEQARQKLLNVRDLQFKQCAGEERRQAGEALMAELVGGADALMRVGKYTNAVGLYRRAMAIAAGLRSAEAQTILAKIEVASARIRVQRELSSLEAALGADPKNATVANRLLMVYLVEVDDARKAARLLDAAGADAKLRKLVPAAAKGVDQATEGECFELGKWYLSLAGRASAAAKSPMLQRALAYYERFQEMHEAQDVQRLLAERSVKSIQDELAKLGAAPDPGGDGWPLGPCFRIQRTEATDEAVKKAMAFLWSAQDKNTGLWHYDIRYSDGRTRKEELHPTCRALAALLSAGIAHTDLRLRKPLEWLRVQSEARLYDAPYTVEVWSSICRARRNVAAMELMKKGVGYLLERAADSSRTRRSVYEIHRTVCAASLAARAGLAVPKEYWQSELVLLEKLQDEKGFWQYSRTSRSTSLPVRSTVQALQAYVVCLHHLGKSRHEALQHPCVRKGVAWAQKYAAGSSASYNPFARDEPIVQLGLTIGQAKVGGVDWWDDVADRLVKSQQADGAIGTMSDKVSSTAEAVLFLVMGK